MTTENKDIRDSLRPVDPDADDHDLIHCACGHIGFYNETDPGSGLCVNCKQDIEDKAAAAQALRDHEAGEGTH